MLANICIFLCSCRSRDLRSPKQPAAKHIVAAQCRILDDTKYSVRRVNFFCLSIFAIMEFKIIKAYTALDIPKKYSTVTEQ